MLPTEVNSPPTYSVLPDRTRDSTAPLMPGDFQPGTSAPVVVLISPSLDFTPSMVVKSPPTYTVPGVGPAMTDSTLPLTTGAKVLTSAPVPAVKAAR